MIPGPETFGEWVTLGSLIVAAVALVSSSSRTARVEHERDQSMRDKLDSIKEAVDDTRRTIDKMDSKLDDHGTRITRVEEQVETLFNRIKRIEDTLDSRKGGTE